MSSLPHDGAMASIFTGYDEVCAAIAPYGDDLSIASDNGRGCTISGKTAAIEEVVAAFEAREIGAKMLKVSHAFHSCLMDPILAPFREAASAVEHAPATHPAAVQRDRRLGG